VAYARARRLPAVHLALADQHPSDADAPAQSALVDGAPEEVIRVLRQLDGHAGPYRPTVVGAVEAGSRGWRAKRHVTCALRGSQ
jgi:hypothetical protein